MTNRTRLVSGRVPVSNSANVTSDRYQYLDLSSAEPNLGTANTGDILSYNPASPGQRQWLSQNTIVGTIGLSAFNQANVALANTIYISGVDTWQNTQLVYINTFAANAYNQANTVTSQLAANVTNIQGIDNYQNTQISSAVANTIYTQGVDASQNTNITSALNLAASAYLVANAALPQSGGTITNSLQIGKDLTVSGNLSVLGNLTSIAVNQLDIGDSLIYIANNNFYSDAVDIGIIGHYNNTGNAHTGIFRDPTLKEWIFFQGYTPEVQANNLINIADPSFAYANVYARYFKGNLISTGDVTIGGNLTVNGTSILNTLNSANANISLLFNIDNYQNTAIQTAFNQANSANILAQAAYNRANLSLQNTSTITVNNNIVIPGTITLANSQTSNSATIVYNATLNSIDFIFN